MQTIAHGNESRRASEVEDATSIEIEVNGGTIEGVLWALMIMVPVYGVVYWILMS